MTDFNNAVLDNPEISTPSSPNLTDQPISFADVRKELGYSLDDLQKITCFPAGKVSALDAMEFGNLGSDTFAKGYISRYAKELKVDAEPYLQWYKSHFEGVLDAGTESESASNATEGASLSNNKDDLKVKVSKQSGLSASVFEKISLLHVSIAAIVLWGSFMVFSQGDKAVEVIPSTEIKVGVVEQKTLPTALESISVSVKSVAESEPVSDTMNSDPITVGAAIPNKVLSEETSIDTASADVALNTVVDQSITDSKLEDSKLEDSKLEESSAEVSIVDGSLKSASLSGTANDSGVVSDISAVSQHEGAQVETANNGETVQEIVEPTNISLEFSFSEACWIKVSDNSGKVLFADTKLSGDNLRLFGEAPLQVMLGNARAAELLVDGEEYAITPTSNRRTHKFTVTPD